MRCLNTVEDRVLSILKKNKEARDDDMKLYVMVCSSYFNCKDNDISKMPFGFVMASYKELNIPHFESVRRSRAKIQSAHPELACSPEVRKARRRCENMYRNYVTNGGELN